MKSPNKNAMTKEKMMMSKEFYCLGSPSTTHDARLGWDSFLLEILLDFCS
jgi:hypothetical protein